MRAVPHHSGRGTSDVWLTARSVLDPLGPFDLDPCTPPVMPWVTAARRYTEADDGLVQPWEGRVWLNPPYSRPAYSRFMARMAAHQNGVALVFARTETRDFFAHVWGAATALLFLEGRLFFHHPDAPRPERCEAAPHEWRVLDPEGRSKVAVCRHCGVSNTNSGAPSVLCAYSRFDAEVLAGCGLTGHFTPLRLPRMFVAATVVGSWRAEVLGWLRSQRGPVSLDALYRAFAGHPKARANPNWRAKVRQTLQRGAGRRVARGQWCAA